MNSCFCFSTSGSLPNTPQEKAQLKWCGRLHRLFLNHLVKENTVIENKAYLLQRKNFWSPRWNHSLPDGGKNIPKTIYYCNWFCVWVIKAIIFLASAINRYLAHHTGLSVQAVSSQSLLPLHTCWTTALGPSSDVTSSDAFPCPRQKDCSLLLGITAICFSYVQYSHEEIKGEYRMVNCRADGLPEIGQKT